MNRKCKSEMDLLHCSSTFIGCTSQRPNLAKRLIIPINLCDTGLQAGRAAVEHLIRLVVIVLAFGTNRLVSCWLVAVENDGTIVCARVLRIRCGGGGSGRY